MFHDLMRALGDGYRSFVEELKESWRTMKRDGDLQRVLEEEPAPDDHGVS